MIWGGWWEAGSGLGTHVHLWWIHVNVWQNQYSIVKLKNKIKKIKWVGWTGSGCFHAGLHCEDGEGEKSEEEDFFQLPYVVLWLEA